MEQSDARSKRRNVSNTFVISRSRSSGAAWTGVSSFTCNNRSKEQRWLFSGSHQLFQPKAHKAKSSVASSCHHTLIFDNERRALYTVSASVSSLVRNDNKRRADFHRNPVRPVRNTSMGQPISSQGSVSLQRLHFSHKVLAKRWFLDLHWDSATVAFTAPAAVICSRSGAVIRDKLSSCWNRSEDTGELKTPFCSNRRQTSKTHFQDELQVISQRFCPARVHESL